jgi:hypothetical protein
MKPNVSIDTSVARSTGIKGEDDIKMYEGEVPPRPPGGKKLVTTLMCHRA